MAKSKSKSIFLCSECGYESIQWYGRCPACQNWDTLSEYTPPTVSDNVIVGAHVTRQSTLKLSDIPLVSTERINTGISELDRVLGGGIVSGMTVLLCGDPGIGKSTLLMQTASALTSKHTVLYVTGEESQSQLKLRAERLSADPSMLVLADIDITNILAEARRIKPDILIIDSIQTIVSPDISGTSGSISQIREITAILMQYAKATGTATFIVGHVTKGGSIAGPKMLEHMVDTVLYFEGERHGAYRLLRAVKNRFGSTNEIGVFEMQDIGMTEVSDPSSIFLSHSSLAGCAVTVSIEGTRPILCEVQALLSSSVLSNPRRTSTGLDNSRLMMLLAVLEQKLEINLRSLDAYVNATGGIRLDDRSNDLAICLSVISAYTNTPLPKETVFIGELSLTGELRSVSRTDMRISECVRLGFPNIILPASSKQAAQKGANIILVNTINEAVAGIFKKL